MEVKQTTNFLYRDTEIEFTLKGKNGVMVNATQMAKIFNKRIDVFLKIEPTKEFIKLLELTPVGGSSATLSREEIIQTKNGVSTFMHRILALKFAAWLSPEFELWVYTTIDKLLFDHYQKLEDSLKESAKRKNQIEKLQEELNQDPRFLELEMLKLRERQASYARSKMNVSQLELFRAEEVVEPLND
jgi:hypothetical protein